MASTTRIASRLALVLAPLAAAASLIGCAMDTDSGSDEQVAADSARPSGLGLGAQGSEVRAVYDYLHRYGYFTNPELAQHYPGFQPAAKNDPADPEVFDAALEEGVRLFQKASGLPVTGVVDADTQRLMQMPRCEMPDYYTPPSMAKVHDPHFFSTLGSPWGKTALTYRYANYTSDMSQTNIRSAISNAMVSWSGASVITFSEVTSGEDMSIGWYTGDHGDGVPFDNGGSNGSNVLAHTFSPGGGLGGDMHFDDYETWSNSTSSGTHLETVAVHEMGHALGLGHSSVTSAVMYAYYSAGRTTLTSDDRAGIWSLYSPYAAQSGDDLQAGEGIPSGTSIWSSDGRFEFAFQGDGNLVLYMSGKVLWAAGTNGKGGDRLMMQDDGNLVMYKSNGDPVWSSGTSSSSNQYSHLLVQNDGNVVIYTPGGSAVWSTHTCCH
jgi:peptidoglycan hydrolase-like protein with peptidoglycan-binding domain